MNKVQEIIEFNPGYESLKGFVEYEKSYFCNENKIIHPNLKSVLNCKHCISEIDKIEYEGLKRLEWFIDGYNTHCLNSLFTKMSTERICELYNVELKYFRPWI